MFCQIVQPYRQIFFLHFKSHSQLLSEKVQLDFFPKPHNPNRNCMMMFSSCVHQYCSDRQTTVSQTDPISGNNAVCMCPTSWL